jgi:hypothetical protein
MVLMFMVDVQTYKKKYKLKENSLSRNWIFDWIQNVAPHALNETSHITLLTRTRSRTYPTQTHERFGSVDFTHKRVLCSSAYSAANRCLDTEISRLFIPIIFLSNIVPLLMLKRNLFLI